MTFPAAIDLRRRMPRSVSRRSMPRVHFSRPSCFGVVIAALVLAAVIIGSFLLVRNSPLVAVNEVKIVGLSGYYERDARAATHRNDGRAVELFHVIRYGAGQSRRKPAPQRNVPRAAVPARWNTRLRFYAAGFRRGPADP